MRVSARNPFRNLHHYLERPQGEHVLVAEHRALDVPAVQREAIRAVQVDDVVTLRRPDDRGMMPAQVCAWQADVVVLASAEQCSLRERDFVEAPAAATDQQVGARRLLALTQARYPVDVLDSRG